MIVDFASGFPCPQESLLAVFTDAMTRLVRAPGARVELRRNTSSSVGIFLPNRVENETSVNCMSNMLEPPTG